MAFRSSNVDARGGIFNQVRRDQINNQYVYADKPGAKAIWLRIRRSTHELATTSTAGLYQLLDPVREAEYTRSGTVARCLPQTREDVNIRIKQLIGARGDARICWVKGAAGAGKSAISQTVAEWCAANRILAARCVLHLLGSSQYTI